MEEQKKGILDGMKFDLNEQQKELLDRYVYNHCRLLSLKEIIMIEEKIFNETLVKYSQYKAYVGDLTGDALEKAKKIGLDYMKKDYEGIESELFVDLIRYSISKNQLDKLEKIEAELNEEMEKAFGDMVSNIFVTSYIEGFQKDIKRHQEMDDKFVAKMNESFKESGKPHEMLMRNCSLEDITLEAMNYLVRGLRA